MRFKNIIRDWAMRTLSLTNLFGEYADLIRDRRDPIVSIGTALSDPPVWAAVRELSETVASLPRRVVDDEGMDMGDHPVLHVFGNSFTPGFNTLETQVLHLLLTGNSYSEIDRAIDGTVLGLSPFPDTQVSRVFVRGGQKYFDIEGKTYDTDKIFHIAGMSWNGLTGESVVQTHGREIELGVAMVRYGLKFFKGGGRAFTILKTKERNLSKEQADLLRNQFVAANSSTDSAGVVAMPDGVEIDQPPNSPDEGQFNESRRFHVRSIARIFKIPPTRLGDDTAATYNNVQQEHIAYVRDAVEPLIKRLSEAFEFYFLEEGLHLEFITDGLLEGTFEEKAGALADLGTKGFLEKNEVRTGLGYQPVEETDGGTEETIVDGNGGGEFGTVEQFLNGSTPSASGVRR